MGASKNLRTFIAAATSNSAGSTATGTAFDVTTAFGGLITIKITNGGTGPTVPATAYVYVSGDNSNFKLLTSFTHSSTNSAVGEFSCELPAAAMYVRVDVTGNTAQAVTCEAFMQELTDIA